MFWLLYVAKTSSCGDRWTKKTDKGINYHGLINKLFYYYFNLYFHDNFSADFFTNCSFWCGRRSISLLRNLNSIESFVWPFKNLLSLWLLDTCNFFWLFNSKFRQFSATTVVNFNTFQNFKCRIWKVTSVCSVLYYSLQFYVVIFKV